MRGIKRQIAGLAGVLLVSLCGMAGAQAAVPEAAADGWSHRGIGAGKGTWDMGVGAFVWKDEFKVRNFQLRGDIDLTPAVRYHAVIRSNQKLDTLSGLDPHFDESYLESQAFFKTKDGTFSTNLRLGTVRYLHFPYPDNIDVFDQVPGVSDLRGGLKTGYSGGIGIIDYAHKSGFGVHATGIRWGFGRPAGTQMIDSYMFYRQDVGAMRVETHFGKLAVRPEPLGRHETGFNVFVGTKWKGYTGGLLYEKLNNQPAYTGIMVTFPMNRVSKALGSVAFDYDRDPEGLAMQLPLLSGQFGGIQKKVPANSVLVGEVKAERLRTYWQNGQVRNYYEHRVSSWGETGGRGLTVVMAEEPWYLQAEALVSPHLIWKGVKTWESDRQGPAQLSQTVTYQYYKAK